MSSKLCGVEKRRTCKHPPRQSDSLLYICLMPVIQKMICNAYTISYIMFWMMPGQSLMAYLWVGISTRSSTSALVVACYSIFYTCISCMLLVVTAEPNMHGLSAALWASDDGLTLFCIHAIFMFRILAHQISWIWVRITVPYALIANWPRCHARRSRNGVSNTNGCPRSMCRNTKLQLQKAF